MMIVLLEHLTTLKDNLDETDAFKFHSVDNSSMLTVTVKKAQRYF